MPLPGYDLAVLVLYFTITNFLNVQTFLSPSSNGVIFS